MKKIIIAVAAIIFLILVFPIKLQYKDGGSIGYKALIYEVMDYHTLDGLRGKTIEILGLEVYDGTYYIIEN